MPPSAARKKRSAPKAARGGRKGSSGKGGGGRDSDHSPLAAVIAVVALLVFVAMFPLGLLGSRVVEFFPSGNPVGTRGETVDRWLRSFVGAGRFAVPFLLLAGGAAVGQWWSPLARKRWRIVSAAALVLLPVSLFLAETMRSGVAEATAWSGYVGAKLGGPLRGWLGWFGAWMMVGGGVLGTSVAAFEFNPLRGKKGFAGKGGGGQGSDRLRLAAALTAVVAALLLVAMFPLGLLGSRVVEFFPPGNPMGSIGEAFNGWLRSFAGAGRLAVPFLLLGGGAAAGKWWSPLARKRLWIVSAAALALVPVSLFLAETARSGVAEATAWSGFLGALLGRPLWEQLGWFGAWVVVGGGVLATSVAVSGFDRALRAGANLWTVARTEGGKLAGGLRGWLGRREPKRAQRGRRAGAGGRAVSRSAKAGPPSGAAAGGPHDAEAGPFGVGPAARGVVKDDGTLTEASGGLGPHREEAGSPAGTTDAGEATGPGGLSRPRDPAGAAAQAEREHELPGLELLAEPEHENRAGMLRELDRLGEVLIETLKTFNIRSEIGGRTTGPAVTQYEVVPAAGIKVNRIANLDADLALAMKARSVRIVAPIPGKGAVGVEIPNPKPEMVRLREILEAPAFVKSSGALPLALGKDLAGHPFVSDLAKMPHALIAGATGSGKSVCLNTVITSLVYRAGPGRLRLLLIDPKMVELSAYSDLPHLRHPVVTDPRDAAGVLKWAVLEMERRYALLSANGVRSLKEFNERVERGVVLKRADNGASGGGAGGSVNASRAGAGDGPGNLPGEGQAEDEDWWIYTDGPLPYIVVVVDELADLMMTVQAEVEKPLTQLAQKARAIGIHLLVATQRPSVNVITGLIKANFPCRIAFRVASKTDSRTILDQNGADALLGHGDMLFLPPGQSEPVRMQGAFISTEETEALMNWYREQADTLEAVKARVSAGEDDILEAVRAMEGGGDDGPEPIKGDWDPLFREAAEACVQHGAGSTSLLQRRLRIGYGRAARIVDQLHEAGVLGPPDGSKPREVTLGAETLDEICPS